jgi:branched-chain amino acid transport system permease protein
MTAGRLGATALLALLLGAPYLLSSTYFVHVLIISFIFVILAAGLDLVLGYCGQYSFVQGAFYGIGAYTSALLAVHFGWPFWVTLPAAIGVAGLSGLVVGIPSLRLAGHFLAITTIAFQVIAHLVLSQWYGLTGGTQGLTGIPAPTPVALFGLTVLRFDTPERFYYLCLAVTLAALFVSWRLVRSRLGTQWLAVSNDELLARVIGINTTWIKVLAFTLSAAMAGAAGALIAHYLRSIHPSEFTIWTSAIILAMVVIGGRGTLLGPVLGALLLTVLPEVLRFADDYKLIVYGGLMIVIITFFPGGLVAGLRALPGLRR